VRKGIERHTSAFPVPCHRKYARVKIFFWRGINLKVSTWIKSIKEENRMIVVISGNY
jgi:hypothetical protein